jgi:tetratricopeptide (TPR) repeat protein
MDAAFSGALHLHQSGRFADAERAYRQILAANPNHVDALHMLGVLAKQAGHLDAALELIGRATQLNPGFAEAHFNLGGVFNQKGMVDRAIEAFRRAVQLKPDFAEAYFSLGFSLDKVGQVDLAESATRRAVEINPGYAEALNNLSSILRNKGKLDEALESARRAAELKPDIAEIYLNLGNVLNDKAQLEEAIAAYRRAAELKPSLDKAHLNLGNALIVAGRMDEAEIAFQNAIRAKPDYAEAFNNLSSVQRKKGEFDEAIASASEAVRLRPDLAEIHFNLGNALLEKGETEAAIAAYRRSLELNSDFAEALDNLGHASQLESRLGDAIAQHEQVIGLKPARAEAHHHLSMALLKLGDFERGWQEHEWRLKLVGLPAAPQFSQPRWDGKPLDGKPGEAKPGDGTRPDETQHDGKRILVYAEQGFGDTIQFARYMPLVAAMGGEVILKCQKELNRLMRGLVGVKQVVSEDPAAADFDVHLPLLSLPLIFRTTLETIPAEVPYLRAEAELAREWSGRMTGAKKFRVGIAWAGSPGHGNDRNRSMRLSQLGPLASAGDCTFFSLQKGEAAKQLADQRPSGMEIADLAGEINDFSDTAAVIDNLDLVIAVDTAVAHLAGAMGKRVWVLLPFTAEWRWLVGREDSPWYPTMRLFRQAQPGDWHGVVQRVVESLLRLE